MYQLKAYPEISDDDFYNKLLAKKEIRENRFTKESLEDTGQRLADKTLEPHQRFVRSYLGPVSPYTSLLLFHETGTGKTGAAVAIAEANKMAYASKDNRIVVLVKNSTIADNFRSELAKEMFSGDSYISQDDRNALIGGNAAKQREVKYRLTRKIRDTYEFITFGTFTNRVLGMPSKSKGEKTRKRGPKKAVISDLNHRVIIIDEIHNITRTETYKALMDVLKNSIGTKIILLTATPAFDRISEIPLIINLLQQPNGPFIENTKDMFTQKDLGFLGKGSQIKPAFSIPFITPKGTDTIKKFTKGKISYLKMGFKNFPKVNQMGSHLTDKEGSIKVSKCQMSNHQYKATLEAIKKDVQSERRDVGYKKTSDAATLTFPDGSFGSSGFDKNTKDGKFTKETAKALKDNLKEYSCKFDKIIKNVKEAKGPVFIFSEYVNKGGIELLTMVLELHGFAKYGSSSSRPKYTILEGKVPELTRQKYLKTFNSFENRKGNLISILLGSPALSEGITLKNVRQVHILEPPWNMSTVEQVKGRAIRNYSHEDLLKEDREVKLFLYASTSPKKEPTIDEVKYRICEEKDRAIKQVERVLKRNAVDCALNIHRNTLDNSVYGNTRNCDYQSCNYTCYSGSLDTQDTNIDHGTYYQSITQEQLNEIKDKIADLYAKSTVYDLETLKQKMKNTSEILLYIALDEMMKEPETIEDQYNRQGSIVQRGKYYIHQPYTIPTGSSLYTLTKPPTRRPPSDIDTYLRDKGVAITPSPEPVDVRTPKKTPQQRRSQAQAQLSPASKSFNEKLRKDGKLYGSSYDRVDKKDDKFRIVNMYDPKNANKKKITGQVCETMNAKDLTNIAQNILKIPLDYSKRITRANLCKAIKKHLKDNNLYLK